MEKRSWVETVFLPDGTVSMAPANIQRSELRMSYTEAHAFGHWQSELSSECSVQDATHHAYCAIHEVLTEIGGFHLWRCWNAIPSIHAEDGKLDRYKQFCLGRHHALLTEGNLLPNELPAASAVGSRGNVFQVSFLAGKRIGTTIENPDQISAYHYPRQYGPAPPSFSRSLVAADRLWLSGTASIAGHLSLHRGDLSGQVRETASRIQTLLANAETHCRRPFAQPKHWKIFLRNAGDAEELMSLLKSNFLGENHFHLVEADICREDLLIEIEGATS